MVAQQQVRAYQPLVPIATFFSLGILADRAFDVRFSLWLYFGFVLILIRIAQCRWRLPWLRFQLVLPLIAIAGGTWHHAYWSIVPANHIIGIATRADRSVNLLGRVSSRQQVYAGREMFGGEQKKIWSRFSIDAITLKTGQGEDSCSGACDVWVEGELEPLRVGDKIRVRGELQAIPAPTNPGESDQREVLRRRRIFVRLNVPTPGHLTIVESGLLNQPMRRAVAKMQNLFSNSIRDSLPPETRSVCAALLLGERSQLDDGLRDAFQNTGTFHLLAISGMHVAVLVGFLLTLCRVGWLAWRGANIGAIVFVIIYSLLIDLSPPVVRAAVMVVAFSASKLVGRKGGVENAYAGAWFIVLVINPTSIFETGTQLSFLAVAVLLAYAHFSRAFRALSPVDRLIEASMPKFERLIGFGCVNLVHFLLMNTVVTCFTTPIIASEFHLVSPVGLLVNPIVAFPMTLAICSGFLTMIVGVFSPAFATPLAILCHYSLLFVMFVVEWAEKLPGAYEYVVGPSSLELICFYISAFVVLLFLYQRQITTKLAAALWMVGATLLIACPMVASMLSSTQAEMKVTFLDVGHGTAVIIQTSEGKTVLYDCGSFGAPDKAGEKIARALWHFGVDQVDVVIISHADSDHYNGLEYLLERIAVGQVLLQEGLIESESVPIRALLEKLTQHQVRYQPIWQGDSIPLDNQTRLLVLHPETQFVAASDNEQSLVLAMNYSGKLLLLPGDIEGEGIRKLRDSAKLKTSILMAPHHGSRHSQPLETCEWSSPEYIVICGGRRDPDLYSAAIGSGKVYHTYHDGAVQFVIRGDELSARSFRTAPW